MSNRKDFVYTFLDILWKIYHSGEIYDMKKDLLGDFWIIHFWIILLLAKIKCEI